jgi:hypothetical protein
VFGCAPDLWVAKGAQVSSRLSNVRHDPSHAALDNHNADRCCVPSVKDANAVLAAYSWAHCLLRQWQQAGSAAWRSMDVDHLLLAACS